MSQPGHCFVSLECECMQSSGLEETEIGRNACASSLLPSSTWDLSLPPQGGFPPLLSNFSWPYWYMPLVLGSSSGMNIIVRHAKS